MIASAINNNYLCHNEIYIDSDYSKQFGIEVGYGHYDVCDDDKQYPYHISIENENRKFGISCSREEVINLIERLTNVLRETD